jgi:hypothetical protein
LACRENTALEVDSYSWVPVFYFHLAVSLKDASLLQAMLIIIISRKRMSNNNLMNYSYMTNLTVLITDSGTES